MFSGSGSRFVPVSDDDLQEWKNLYKNQRTEKNARWAFRCFEEFRCQVFVKQGIVNGLLDMDHLELSNCLRKFIIGVRRRDGKEYAPDTLVSLVSSLNRWYNDGIRTRYEEEHPDFDPPADLSFLTLHDVEQVSFQVYFVFMRKTEAVRPRFF